MGSLFGSSKMKSTTEPWAEQQQYLLEGFQAAQGARDTALAQPAYSGDFTAPMNPYQTGALNTAYDFFTQQSPQVGGALTNAGMTNTNVGTQFGQNAQNILTQAGQDPTGQTIANAARYGDNPALTGVIDAALGDVSRAFGDDLGRLNAAASNTGNINSTRTGVVESRLRDDAMDRAAQIASGIRYDAYNTGLGLSANQLQQGVTNQLAANQQIAGAGALGLDQTRTGQALIGTGYNAGINIGNQYQQQDQNVIQGNLAKDQYTTNRDLDLIGKYMSIVNDSYGGTSTQPGPSMMQNLLGMGLTAAGIYSGFKGGCWLAREVYGEDDPRWKAFRLWLVWNSPNWFHWLYYKYGQRGARIVHFLPFLKPPLRGLMNLAARRYKK